MAKHEWRDALCKLGRNPNGINLQDLIGSFKQIELLKVVKQKSKTIVVDDNTDKQKKSSSQRTTSAKATANTKVKPPGKDKEKICVLGQQHKLIASSKMQTQHKHPVGDHMSMEDLYASNLKQTKQLKKYKKQKGKHKSSYELESLDSDYDSS
eukprot:15336084-Ditylum_brightwellii.AAC.1